MSEFSTDWFHTEKQQPSLEERVERLEELFKDINRFLKERPKALGGTFLTSEEAQKLIEENFSEYL